jgi:hypothetical protein
MEELSILDMAPSGVWKMGRYHGRAMLSLAKYTDSEGEYRWRYNFHPSKQPVLFCLTEDHRGPDENMLLSAYLISRSPEWYAIFSGWKRDGSVTSVGWFWFDGWNDAFIGSWRDHDGAPFPPKQRQHPPKTVYLSHFDMT